MGKWPGWARRKVLTPIFSPMNSPEYPERLDVGKKRREKIFTQSLLALLVELVSLDQVGQCGWFNSHPHGILFRISSLATSQSILSTAPLSNARVRSSRISLCHSGISTRSGSDAKSDQSTSRRASFSAKGICRISACPIMDGILAGIPENRNPECRSGHAPPPHSLPRDHLPIALWRSITYPWFPTFARSLASVCAF